MSEENGYDTGGNTVTFMDVVSTLPWDRHRRTRRSTTSVVVVEESVAMGGSTVGVVLTRGLISLEFLFVPTRLWLSRKSNNVTENGIFLK